MPTCDDCGLLGVRDLGSRQITGVESQFRKTGRQPPPIQSKFNKFEGIPVCTARVIDIEEIVTGLMKGGRDTQTAVLEVLREQRPCESYIRWLPGFSPQSHHEIKMGDDQRKFQKDLVDHQLESQREIAKEQGQRSWQLILVAGLLGFVAGLGPKIIDLLSKLLERMTN